jgi:hypothetical protein
MRIKILTLMESQHQALTNGFRQGEHYIFRMPSLAILLKSEGLSSDCVEEQVKMTVQSVKAGQNDSSQKASKICIHVPDKDANPSWTVPDKDAVSKAIESARQRSLAECFRQGNERVDLRAFFIPLARQFETDW